MKKIGFIGYGTIGKQIVKQVQQEKNYSIEFVVIGDDREKDEQELPYVKEITSDLFEKVDLVVEVAHADIIEKYGEKILRSADLLAFSTTAFSNEELYKRILESSKKYGTKVYIPHGAILGLDGLFDGRMVIDSVTITTTKSPKSLGRQDTERTVVYEGSTKEICKLYPRNVNVHAAIAMAGLGFDKTKSVLISDPSVSTNAHVILIKGQGIEFELKITSISLGGVTGAYTPISAFGSLQRAASNQKDFIFV